MLSWLYLCLIKKTVGGLLIYRFNRSIIMRNDMRGTRKVTQMMSEDDNLSYKLLDLIQRLNLFKKWLNLFDITLISDKSKVKHVLTTLFKGITDFFSSLKTTFVPFSNSKNLFMIFLMLAKSNFIRVDKRFHPVWDFEW